MYRAMIYFAHSTLVIYSKTIVDEKEMTVGAFREKNKDVVQRVYDEGLSIFEYELSYEQISKAIYTYLKSKYDPSSIHEVPVHEIKQSI